MILFDARWVGDHGIGRFAKEIMARLPEFQSIKSVISPLSPIDPFYTSWKIKTVGPTIYYSPGFNPPLFSSSPFVFMIYDLTNIYVPANSSFLKKAYFNLIVRPACHRAFRVLTTSEFSRVSISQWSGVSKDKIVNVSCGVSAEYRPDGQRYSPDYPYLLYVGNRKPHKNLPRLLEAFSISGVKKDVKLLLSGEPDKRTMNLIQEKKLKNCVVFTGFIPEKKLPHYYRGAEMLVLPSLYEGFGLPVIEAMACGTPVVTSNITSLPEVAGSAALLVDPENTGEIADAICRILNDSLLREKMRTSGIKQAGLFSWGKTTSLVLGVLELAAKNG